jgi:hypothetical protein
MKIKVIDKSTGNEVIHLDGNKIRGVSLECDLFVFYEKGIASWSVEIDHNKYEIKIEESLKVIGWQRTKWNCF